MRRSSVKAAVLAGVLLLGALIPALAQQRGPGLVGDVNGDGRITSADALAVYAYLAGRPIPATFDVPGRGDADGDGRITRADAELIMRVAVGQAAGDRPVGKPAVPGTPPAEGPLRLQCVADVRGKTVRCSEPGAATPHGVQADRIIYGGQHVYVSVLTGEAQMQADTFSFDVRVKNLLEQAIGTHDGINVDPVKVFFASGILNTTTPANDGAVTSVNHDGQEAFTTSEPQKFFGYAEIIQPQATSAARRWKLHVGPGVESFTFSLYVSAPVVHSRGYVDVYPDSAVLSAGDTLRLSDTVRSALGRPIPGATVTWSSGDPAVATVSSNGIVTAVADGTVEITAFSAPRSPGKMTLVVRTASVDSSTIAASPATLPVHDTSSITVQLRSANGTPVTSSGGTVVLIASAGTLTAVTDNNDGTYSATLRSTAVGLVKVSGTLNGNALRDTAQVTFTPGAAAGYVVTSSASSAAAGSPVTITAQTVDADSNAVAAGGVVVNWSSANGGSFASPTLTTDSAGTATVVFTTSTTAGVTHTVTATDSAGLTGTSGGIVTQVGAAAKLAVVQQPPQSVVADSSITPAVTVAIQDVNGNTVTTATDSVSVNIPTNPVNGTLSGTLTVAAVNGLATFSDLSIDKAGTGYTVGFTGAALTGATSNAFTVTAGAASKLALTAQPSDTAQSGAAFPRQPVVQLQDASGNAVAQAGVSVTASITTGGGTLGGTATVNTDGNGTATFTDLAISGTVGDRTLSFSAAGLTGAISATVYVQAGAASRIVMVTQPSDTVQSGVAFPRQPAVQLQDANGNVVAQAGVGVTASIAGGGGTLGGTATASTDGSGTATFTNLAISGTVGDRTLSFSAGALTGATSATVYVQAGAAAQLGIAPQPSDTVQSRIAFPRQPAVQLRDASGNPVAQAGVTVTAAIASGGGTLGGTATASTDATGAATFTDLSIAGTSGGRTLAFSATGLTGVESDTVVVTAGAAAGLVFTGQPSNVVAGSAIAPAVQVSIIDADSNVVTSATDTVRIAIGNNPSTGTLSGTVAVAADGGVASFAGLGIDKVGTGYTLTAASGALPAATSGAFDVTPGALHHFRIDSIGGQTANLPFNVTVTAQDQYDNTVTSFADTVVFTSTPAGGITSGATSGAFTAGVLASHGVTMGTAGTFTLTATRKGGTESGTSNSFQVQPSPTYVTWTGAVSTDWSNAGNWDALRVPAAGDTAVIAATAQQPVITDGDKTVLGLVMNAASATTLGLGGFTLTVTGDVNAPTGTVNAGTLLVSGSGALVQGTANALRVSGGIKLQGAVKATGAVSVTGSLYTNGQPLTIAIP